MISLSPRIQFELVSEGERGREGGRERERGRRRGRGRGRGRGELGPQRLLLLKPSLLLNSNLIHVYTYMPHDQ